MLPSHPVYSGTPSSDITDSFSLTQSGNAIEDDLQPTNSQQLNIPKTNHNEALLQLIQQSHLCLADDLDLSDAEDQLNDKQDTTSHQIAGTNKNNAHQLEHPLLLNTPSDLPISSKLNEQGRSQQFEEEATNDNRNKRQKLHQSQLSQNHPQENVVHPISSKNWSPQPMETPPPSTNEQSGSGRVFDRNKRYYIQPIPAFRPKEPPGKLQTKEKQTLLNNKENATISVNRPNAQYRQQINGIDPKNHRRDEQQKVTNVNNHAQQTQKLWIHRDEDNAKGHVNKNQRETPVPLSSIDVNQVDHHHQPHIETQHCKQQNNLEQPKNNDTPALSDRNHRQEPRATKGKKVLPGEQLQVKGHWYTILNQIGHGGSSAVYRALHHKSKQVHALKHVAIEEVKDTTIRDYRNECNFLENLRPTCTHIPRLYNHEYDRSAKFFVIVLELGEMDFLAFMEQQKSKPLNMNFVRWHAQQMIEAVAEIHDQCVIHRDLKPANFILKAGSLKLIDFGISKQIKGHRETVKVSNPTGTINYMSPEAFTYIGDDRQKYTQIGRPSDIWSLGCILYQMIYGRTPFHGIPSEEKSKAICDPSFKIDYPSVVHFNDTVQIAIGNDTVSILQACLDRNPLLRLSAKELLQHRFFHPFSSTL